MTLVTAGTHFMARFVHVWLHCANRPNLYHDLDFARLFEHQCDRESSLL